MKKYFYIIWSRANMPVFDNMMPVKKHILNISHSATFRYCKLE